MNSRNATEGAAPSPAMPPRHLDSGRPTALDVPRLALGGCAGSPRRSPHPATWSKDQEVAAVRVANVPEEDDHRHHIIALPEVTTL